MAQLVCRSRVVSEVAAHDRVALPMSDVLTPFDFHRAVANGPLAGQEAPGLMAAVALAPEFAHDARVAPQVTTRPLVPPDAPVDGLVTDGQRAALPEHAGDLLGTPLSASSTDTRAISATLQCAPLGHPRRWVVA